MRAFVYSGDMWATHSVPSLVGGLYKEILAFLNSLIRWFVILIAKDDAVTTIISCLYNGV